MRGVARSGLIAAVAAMLLLSGGPQPGTPAGEDDERAGTAVAAATYAAPCEVVDPAPRLSGADRHATAVAAAEATPSTSRTVVIARSDDLADALAAVPLAAHLDAELLLTRSTSLPDVTRDRIVAAGHETAIIVGGAAAVSGIVVGQLESIGLAVSRRAGPDRYATAVAVSGLLPSSGRLVVASGASPIDAFAAGPLAAAWGAPILLTPTSRLPDAVRLAAEGRDVVIVGGTAVVADEVQSALAEGARSVLRRSGVDRFATALELGRDTSAAAVIVDGRSSVDALIGSVHAARSKGVLALVADDVPVATATLLQGRDLHTLVGGLAVLPEARNDALVAAGAARRWAAFHPAPCSVLTVARSTETRISQTGDPVVLEVRADDGVDARIENGQVVLRWTPAVAGTARLVAVDVRSPANEDVRVVAWPVVFEDAIATTLTPDGYARVDGAGPVIGSAGRLATYSVEFEPAVAERTDPDVWVETVIATLADPRSWTGTGQRRLQRVDRSPDVRVVLARPSTVDRECRKAGLQTGGVYSCWNGSVAIVNLDRWIDGVAHVSNQDTYRAYVINHEVGHGLGNGHVSCRGSGLAPVMAQQSKRAGLGACQPNGWPYP